MVRTSYVIALGSNRRHGRHGSPARILRAALAELETQPVRIRQVSKTRLTRALGPGGRDFANGAALVESSLSPPELLDLLKRTERSFGRRGGQMWGARVLDLDIILWSGGAFEAADLLIPHRSYRERRFVLEPLADIVPGWRDPISGTTIRQLRHRLRRPRPVDPRCSRS